MISRAFHFESCPETLEALRVSVPSDINNKEALFDALEVLLDFPGYFGRNWDALEELLTDLSWLTAKVVILEHVALPQLPEKELKIYLQILGTSVLSWRLEDNHCLWVYFAEADKVEVEKLCKIENSQGSQKFLGHKLQ